MYGIMQKQLQAFFILPLTGQVYVQTFYLQASNTWYPVDKMQDEPQR